MLELLQMNFFFGVEDTEHDALQDHDFKFMNLLERCRQKNIKLNKDKLKF